MLAGCHSWRASPGRTTGSTSNLARRPTRSGCAFAARATRCGERLEPPGYRSPPKPGEPRTRLRAQRHTDFYASYTAFRKTKDQKDDPIGDARRTNRPTARLPIAWDGRDLATLRARHIVDVRTRWATRQVDSPFACELVTCRPRMASFWTAKRRDCQLRTGSDGRVLRGRRCDPHH